MLKDQADLYYIAFPYDSWRLKGTVTIAYILELIHLASSTRDAFRVFVNGWGDPQQLMTIGFYWLNSVVMVALSELLNLSVQGQVLC